MKCKTNKRKIANDKINQTQRSKLTFAFGLPVRQTVFGVDTVRIEAGDLTHHYKTSKLKHFGSYSVVA